MHALLPTQQYTSAKVVHVHVHVYSRVQKGSSRVLKGSSIGIYVKVR